MNQLAGAAGAAQEERLGAHAIAAAHLRVLRRLAALTLHPALTLTLTLTPTPTLTLTLSPNTNPEP